MADFPGLTLTDQGLRLQALAQTGERLAFTRGGVGDGTPDRPIDELTALIDERQSLPLHALDWMGDGTSRVTMTVTNAQLEHGFYLRELGLYALDPATDEEHLYAYASAGDRADYLPAQNSATVVNNTINVFVMIGNAPNVVAHLDLSTTYVTTQALDDHAQSRNHPYATTTLPGLIELATRTEGRARSDDRRALTAAALDGALGDHERSLRGHTTNQIRLIEELVTFSEAGTLHAVLELLGRAARLGLASKQDVIDATRNDVAVTPYALATAELGAIGSYAFLRLKDGNPNGGGLIAGSIVDGSNLVYASAAGEHQEHLPGSPTPPGRWLACGSADEYTRTNDNSLNAQAQTTLFRRIA